MIYKIALTSCKEDYDDAIKLLKTFAATFIMQLNEVPWFPFNSKRDMSGRLEFRKDFYAFFTSFTSEKWLRICGKCAVA